MNTRLGRRDLAINLCARSTCHTKMAAVISDHHGIFSWGWNHMGSNGLGLHAEEFAIERANPRRLRGSIITVAGYRRRGSLIISRPCDERCLPLIRRCGIKRIELIDNDKEWHIWHA